MTSTPVSNPDRPGPAWADGIAAICLAMRDQFGLMLHVYFDWTEGSPLVHFPRFILWGSGEVAPGHPRGTAPRRA